MTIYLDGETLKIEDIVRIANDPEVTVELSRRALERMEASRALVDAWVEGGEVIYGVTTGFGEFANVVISRDDIERLQQNLIRSHAAGVGDPIPKEITRAMMALRVNALARGFSGIRTETAKTILAMLNRDVIPWIPSQGSVGSSGDLAQLAHLALAAIGEGDVWGGGGKCESGEMLWRNGIEPIVLKAKEGLALINGTQLMTAYGCVALDRARCLAKNADIIAAMSVDALRGTDRAFDERLHRARPHRGQLAVASNMRLLMQNSEIRESHRHDDDRVQDAYSLRCIPQVHGASRDALNYVAGILQTEINAATDNPLIFPEEGDYLEGGNFHGQPVALAMDFLSIAVAELGNISERRTERLVNGSLSRLPRFLTEQGGLNSGYMIAQYTAAALVSENKSLAHPASVDSIPTSANQEDHNSMGSIGARKAWQITRNVANVIAIEYVCAAQGLDFLAPLTSSPVLQAVHAELRKSVPHLAEDRVIHKDIDHARVLIESQCVIDAAEGALGLRLE